MKPKYQIPKELTMPDHTQIKMALTNLPSAITVPETHRRIYLDSEN